MAPANYSYNLTGGGVVAAAVTVENIRLVILMRLVRAHNIVTSCAIIGIRNGLTVYNTIFYRGRGDYRREI